MYNDTYIMASRVPYACHRIMCDGTHDKAPMLQHKMFIQDSILLVVITISRRIHKKTEGVTGASYTLACVVVVQCFYM